MSCWRCRAAGSTPTATRWCATSWPSTSCSGRTSFRGTDRPLVDLLLEPHRCYLHAIRELRGLTDIRAMAHITGGGVIDNVPRVLPEGLAATIERSTWDVPAIFGAIQKAGGVHLEEMWRTFNMGVGMVVIVPPDVPEIASAAGIPVWRIGEVVPQSGTRRVILK